MMMMQLEEIIQKFANWLFHKREGLNQKKKKKKKKKKNHVIVWKNGREESAFFKECTQGCGKLSGKTLLTEFNTHFVASYTLIEGGGCADTMTEGRRVIDLLS